MAKKFTKKERDLILRLGKRYDTLYHNDLYEFSCPMSEEEKLGVPFINPDSPYIPVDERETLTINFDDNDDQVFGSDIKANLKPFFVNLMCKVHNIQFIEDKELRNSIINECSHELACFCDFLDNQKGAEILEYKKNTLFE